MISKLGYSKGSPYRGRKSLTINTPNGLIDMSNTDIPLYAEDETGYRQLLEPYSGMHQFPGKKVVETPMGNIYSKGGLTDSQLYDFLFSDDDEDDAPVTAPEAKPNSLQKDKPVNMEAELEQERMYDMAISRVMEERTGRPSKYSSNPIANPNIPNAPTASGDKGQYAFDYLVNKGIEKHVAAGMVGNFIQESGNFRQDVIEGRKKGDSGLATGIAQWHPDRWKQGLKWAQQNNRNLHTLEGQLDFAVHEATQRGDLQRVRAARNSAEAANLFAKHYERPKIIDPNRAKYAQRFYQYGGLINEIFDNE